MINKKALLALALSVMLLLTACGAPAQGGTSGSGSDSGTSGSVQQPVGEPNVGGTLNVGLAGDPYSVNSWTSNDMNASLITNIVFPRLMEIDENGDKVPYIIKEYTMNETGDQFTVTLHEGLSWHDGVPFTTADLAFTAEYTVKHALSFGADMYRPVASTEIVDEYTIIYNLTAPAVNFLSQVGYWVQIMPKHIYENVEDPNNFAHPVIGFGPYKYVEHKKGEYYSFTRVENWPLANDGKGAYIENIVFRIFPDANAMILAMKNGEIDACASSMPTVAQKQLTAEGDRYQVLSVPSLGFGYFAFSYDNPNLADPIMRKAIAMSVDRDAIVTIGMQDSAMKMETPISPVYKKSVESNITFPAFDIDAANKLLDEAGYKDTNGDGVREDKAGKPMKFTVTYRNTTVNADSIANIFKDNCAKVGLQFETQSLDPATYTDKVTKQGDFDVNFIDWGVIDDPDSSLATIYHSSSNLNFMHYKNEKMDKILDEVVKQPVYEERIKMMDEFQKLFIEELPTINAWVRINAFGVSSKFTNWSAYPGLHGIMNAREIVKVYLAQPAA